MIKVLKALIAALNAIIDFVCEVQSYLAAKAGDAMRAKADRKDARADALVAASKVAVEQANVARKEANELRSEALWY